ncbi:hypothetical protein JCM12856_10460 [Spirochaeta dissipatitropha]
MIPNAFAAVVAAVETDSDYGGLDIESADECYGGVVWFSIDEGADYYDWCCGKWDEGAGLYFIHARLRVCSDDVVPQSSGIYY